MAAASARLCVETIRNIDNLYSLNAAASARLCVETLTQYLSHLMLLMQPPPRGCVLKH